MFCTRVSLENVSHNETTCLNKGYDNNLLNTVQVRNGLNGSALKFSCASFSAAVTDAHNSNNHTCSQPEVREGNKLYSVKFIEETFLHSGVPQSSEYVPQHSRQMPTDHREQVGLKSSDGPFYMQVLLIGIKHLHRN